jgi:hypothetical protein
MLLTTGCSFVWGDELKGFDTSPTTHWPSTFTHLLSEHLDLPWENAGSCGASNHKIFRDLCQWFNGKDYSFSKRLRQNKIATPETVTHMVVLWSAWQRDEVPVAVHPSVEDEHNIQRFDNVTQYSPHRIGTIGYLPTDMKQVTSDYFHIHSDHRKDVMQNLPYWLAVQQMAKAHNIKLIQGCFHDVMWREICEIMADKEPLLKEYRTMIGDMLGQLDRSGRIGLGRFKTLHGLVLQSDPKEGLNLYPHGHPNEKTQVVFAEQLKNIFKECYDG